MKMHTTHEYSQTILQTSSSIGGTVRRTLGGGSEAFTCTPTSPTTRIIVYNDLPRIFPGQIEMFPTSLRHALHVTIIPNIIPQSWNNQNIHNHFSLVHCFTVYVGFNECTEASN